MKELPCAIPEKSIQFGYYFCSGIQVFFEGLFFSTCAVVMPKCFYKLTTIWRNGGVLDLLFSSFVGLSSLSSLIGGGDTSPLGLCTAP